MRKLKEAPLWFGTTLYNLFSLIVSTFPEEEFLKEEKRWTLRSLIVHFAMPSRGDERRNKGPALYTSSQEMLTTYLEDPTRYEWRPGEPRWRRGWIDWWCWYWWTADTSPQHLWQQVVVCSWWMRKSAKGKQPKCFWVRRWLPPWSLWLILVENRDHCACPDLHQFLFYNEESTLAFAKPLKIKELTAPPFSVVI